MAKEKPSKVDISGVTGDTGNSSMASDVAGAMKGAGVAVQESPPANATTSSDPSDAILRMVEKGRKQKPPRIMLVGTEGIGKSTWASEAPDPIFLQTEDGLDEIATNKLPLARSYETVRAQIKAIAFGKHDYSTVVIDTLDGLETLIWDKVARGAGKQNIEEIGFARGYKYALSEWREIQGLLKACREERGMAVILIAHSITDKAEDPEHPPYDRFSPKLNKHARALWVEWVDAVLFATRRVAVKKIDQGFNSEKHIASPVGAAGGERILKTTGGPTLVAKNRYSLPEILPLSWAAFAEALQNHYQKES